MTQHVSFMCSWNESALRERHPLPTACKSHEWCSHVSCRASSLPQMASRQHACTSKLAHIVGPIVGCAHVIKQAHRVPLFLLAFFMSADYVFLCILLSQCSGNVVSASFGDAAIGSMEKLLAELHSKHLLSNGGTFRAWQKVKDILSLIYLFSSHPLLVCVFLPALRGVIAAQFCYQEPGN